MALQSARGPEGTPLHIFGLGASQNVAYAAAGGASAASAALSANAEAVFISGTQGDVRVAIGQDPVANAQSTLLPHPFAMTFKCNPGDKVAVISNDTNVGSISVTELSGSGPA